MTFHSEKYDKIIAIDPDTQRSGVCLLDVKTKRVEVCALSFPKLLDYLMSKKAECTKSGESLCVVVEAGWINKSNWHVTRRDNLQSASAKGNATGRNHETGRKIVECAKHYKMNVIEVQPLRKIWKGNNRKITHEELSQFVSIPGRTSQDQRDAVLIAWCFAGLPVSVKTMR